MRSYYSHLEQLPRPILRASALFPVVQREGISTRILFLGYWLLKRQIQEIACIVSLRNNEGALCGRTHFLVDEPRSYSIELKDLVSGEFEGSLEIEFFSTRNLYYPYAAVTVNYYGADFSSVVHTAERTYNDYEDMMRNSETEVAESGFNLHADTKRAPFLTLINGPLATDPQEFILESYNLEGKKLVQKFPIKALGPYEAVWIHPAEDGRLASFLQGTVGAAKAFFRVKSVFPRLLAGNFIHDPTGLVVTHTYYDTSHAKTDKDYWSFQEDGWYIATLTLPAHTSGSHETYVYFYPIYSPAAFVIDLEAYSQQGKLIKRVESVLVCHEPKMARLRLKELVGVQEEPFSFRLIARALDGSKLPARIKVSLDISASNEALPCNICTCLQPFVPAWKDKKTAFRWGPVLTGSDTPSVWIMNNSPKIHYTHTSNVTLNFYRDRDTKTITRKVTIPPHGCLYLECDEELKEFFGGRPGWYVALSDNPYMSTYYFATSRSGIVGGDHGF